MQEQEPPLATRDEAENDHGRTALDVNAADFRPSDEYEERHGPTDIASSFWHMVTNRAKEMFNNLNTMEISGSLGDLGTFIPLTIALAKNRSIYIAPTLFFAGLSNIMTGVVWDVPMPVQPMKSISAVAIADVWSSQEMATSGIAVGAIVLFLGVSNIMELINRIIPISVVSGMQIGLGLRLMGTGMKNVRDLQTWVGNYGDCILVAVLLSLCALYWLREPPSKHVAELQAVGLAHEENDRSTAAERRMKDDDGSHPDEEASIGKGATSNGSSSDDVSVNERDKKELKEIVGNNNTASDDSNTANEATLQQMNRSLFRSVIDQQGREEPASTATTNANNDPATPKRMTLLTRMRRILCCCIPALAGADDESKGGASPPHPVGVYLFLCGCLFATVRLIVVDGESNGDGFRWLGAPVALWALEGVQPDDWKVGLLEGAIPQLPLTTLNSVISVCALCTALFPNKIPGQHARHQSNARNGTLIARLLGRHSEPQKDVLTRRTVAVSVGLMNLALCPFGSMPNCHGAGGLAGQYRFGARSGTSVAFLGLCKMLLAIFVGSSVLVFLDAFPTSILGVMICISGGELAVTGWTVLAQFITKQSTAEWTQFIETLSLPSSTNVDSQMKDVRSKFQKTFLRQHVFVTIVTASVMVGLGRTDYGVLAGWVAHLIYADGWRSYAAFVRGRC